MRCVVALFFLADVLAGQTGTIHGVVKDSAGVPLAGISVSAGRTSDAPNGRRAISMPLAMADTDEGGKYALRDLAPGLYVLKSERVVATQEITVDAGGDIAVDFVIPAAPSISGHVVDENKDPAIDAFVWLLTAEIQNGAIQEKVIGPKVTVEDGAYSFDIGLEANRRYYVLVDRQPPTEFLNRDPIQVPTYYPSATRMDDAMPVLLRPGEHAEADIKIATEPFYCVDGKVQSAGKPAAVDFAVFESPLAATRMARVRSGSDEKGMYHFCGLPAGAYRLSTDKGFTEFTIARSDVQHIDLSLEMAYPKVQIDWDGPAAEPDLPKLNPQADATLRKFAALAGIGDNPSRDDLKKLGARLFESDDALRDAFTKMSSDPDFHSEDWVNLMRSLMPVRATVGVMLNGIDGGFTGPFKDPVPAGDYTVDVYGPPDSYPKEITFNGLKVADGVLRLAPAASGTLHVLMTRGAASLNVSVADSDGKPVPNATVMAIPESVATAPALSRLVRRGQTDQSGNYTVPALVPGRYRVLATSQTIRWDVPDDLEKVLLAMFQAKDVELDAKASMQIALTPVLIY